MYEPYTYVVDNVRVIDGDTLKVDLDMGFGIWQKDVSVRLHGLDCPEKNTPEGVKALSETKIWVDNTKKMLVRVVDKKKDKYGRILGMVGPQCGTDKHTLNSFLLDGGFAKAYFGGKKE
jgi:micrococcal nuclease